MSRRGTFDHLNAGDWLTQRREELELCGLFDPDDYYFDAPQGPPVRRLVRDPYPLDAKEIR